MKRLLTTAALLVLAMYNSPMPKQWSCISKAGVNMTDNWPTIVKTERKVMVKIKKDLDAVLTSINSPDRDDKIKALLAIANDITGKVLNQTGNSDIDDAINMTFNSTVNTIAFIEKNAKNPSSSNIID